MKGFEQWEHAFRIVERPAHVSVCHHIDTIADHLADSSHQLDITLHPLCSVDWSPSETQLHRRVSFVLVALRFNPQFVQRHAVESACIYGNALLCLPTQ